MGEPFRDAEGSALERAQALEAELEDARAELRTRVSDPRASDEARIERLEIENAELRDLVATLRKEDAPKPSQRKGPPPLDVTNIAVVFIGLVVAALTLLVEELTRH
ncbi:MAG: hypothetical protein JWM74_6309 [Myxococcaceae bacterium]|nr:hypothetical protein [Myxococcaceae bacterium]